MKKGKTLNQHHWIVAGSISLLLLLNACRPAASGGQASTKPVIYEPGESFRVEDLCPYDAEVLNGYLDHDGCPDELPDTIRCEHSGRLWIGGAVGPRPQGCTSASPGVFVSTFDDTRNSGELQRLSVFVGQPKATPGRFRPASITLISSLGGPAHAATVSFTGKDGTAHLVRAGMDGRLVLDRANVHEGSSLRVDWCGTQKTLPTIRSSQTVVLTGQCSKKEGDLSLKIAIIIDGDAEIEKERESLAASMEGGFSALGRSNGIVPQVAIIGVSNNHLNDNKFSGDHVVVAQRIRDVPLEGETPPRELFAGALRRASELEWSLSGGNVLILLSRRAPFVDNSLLGVIDDLQRQGVRIHPIMGRAPAALDEMWVRWASAMTSGDFRLRAAWGDVALGEARDSSVCSVYESLEWSVIRMLREEADGIKRSPPPGLLHGDARRTPDGVCSGASSWRLTEHPDRGIIYAYEPGEAEMAPEVGLLFDEVQQILHEFPSLDIRVTGYCDIDEAPSREGREALSLSRAMRARALLIGSGVAPRRISVKGLESSGSERVDRSTEARSRNRRVEFRLQGHGI